MTATYLGDAESMAAAAVPSEVLLESAPPANAPLYFLAKRVLDIVLAAVGLLVAAPVLAFAGVAIYVTGGRPIFFRQQRVGYAGKKFMMWKLRTMEPRNDDSAHREYVRSMFESDQSRKPPNGDLHKLNDDRVTSVGRVLRRTSIDELPQLFNVLRGEMSLVGPRPALAWEVELFGPFNRLRLKVKPGITGLWQVSGRNRLTMREALELDCVYACHRSLLLDLKILLKTIPVVVARQETA